MQSYTSAPVRRTNRRRKLRDMAMITVSVFATIAMAVWLLQPGASVSAQEIPNNGEGPRQVTVSGAAQVQVEPTTAHVTLGVETVAEEASTALDDNNVKMQALLDEMRAYDIADENIRTHTLRLIPQYEQSMASGASLETEPALPPAPGRETAGELVGYRAVNSIQITIKNDLTQLGDLIDTAVASGANSIRSIRFDVEDSANLLDQARQDAWADAQHKAEQLAALAGTNLGSVLTVNENSIGVQPIVQDSFDNAAAAVPIQSGTQPVRVDLYITWELVE